MMDYGKKDIGIIDFEKKGNLIRFYLGDIAEDFHGDDWDDTPYEHNAGKVYDEYQKGYVDVTFPFDFDVVDASEDWHYRGNSPFSKYDMREGKAPCVIALKRENDWEEACYSEYLGDNKAYKIYFKDLLHELTDTVSKIQGCTYTVSLW